MADFNLGRLKFNWKGVFALGTSYVKDDVVRYGGSAYVCVLAHTSVTSWATNSSKFELMVDGSASSALTTEGDLLYYDGAQEARLPIGTSGQALIVDDAGIPSWQGLSTAQSIYYVKADGNDTNNGSNLNEAFRTIRHACDTVTGPATIYIKGGLYYEVLPLTVPSNVTIVGDGQRTTGVAPVNISNNSATITATTGAQTSTTIVIDDSADTGNAWTIGDTITISSIQSGSGISGTVTITNIQYDTPTVGNSRLTVSFTSQTVTLTDCTISSDHSEGTMWLLNDGATLNKMYFKDMGGFLPNLSTPEDITTSTSNDKGIFVALDPTNSITHKSPYVLECSAFSDLGGIGAVVDGDVHVSGNKSIVFHSYTCILNDGVGFWVNGQGKAEIVSCFTYYCWYGYTTTNGGKIRALNGNNSYGTYGVISRGFDPDETAVTGALYGSQITYDEGSLTGGEFAVGNTITGSPSGAVGTITNVQTAVNKIYYNLTSGTFTDADTISTGGGSPVTATIATAGVEGQKGFVLVADGFSEAPRPGGSVSIAGDTFSYVIQSVGGTYTNSSSVLILVLSNEKPASSANNAVVTIRYAYSNARLTGHDFLSIGTGDKITTNYPGEPTQPKSQANEVIESYPGRVFYVSTDQDGNFRVGDYFRVDQATGRATLNASAFDLSGLTSLRLGSIGAQLGELVNEFSSDATLSGDSNEAVPTEAAVRGYFGNVATNLVPLDDDVQTLGTPSKRWNHLYVGPGTITIGTLTISDNAGTLEVKAGSTPAPAAISTISNGTSNVSVAAGADVTITAANTLAATFSGANTTLAGELRGPSTFTIDPAVVGNDTGTVVIKGNLQVDGTTTTINSTTLTVDDKNIELASVATPTDITADGAGITVKGATDKTLNWVNATDAWTSSENIDLATGKKILINGTAGTDNKFLKTISGGLEWADAAVTVSDITTNGTYYPLFTTATSGTVTSASVTSNATTIFSFNPSNGTLSAGRKLTLSGSTSGSVSFQAAAAAGSVTYTLPSADAAVSGYALVSNASGTLSWAAAGASLADDTSTTTLYPVMSTSATGSLSSGKTTASKFTFNASTGTLTATILTASSDARLKENVQPILSALDKVLALEGVLFNRIGSTIVEIGFIAQQVESVVPELVFTDEKGFKSVAYGNTVALLIEAIKEQQTQINELKGKI